MANYPINVSVLDLDAVQVSPAIREAATRFAAAKPYTGSLTQRQRKFRTAVADICEASGIPAPRVVFKTDERLSSGMSFYSRRQHLIGLVGRLSVITCLHEIAHAIHGPSEYVACAWSLRLFRDCFPISWSRLRFDGHVAVNEGQTRSRSRGSDDECI